MTRTAMVSGAHTAAAVALRAVLAEIDAEGSTAQPASGTSAGAVQSRGALDPVEERVRPTTHAVDTSTAPVVGDRGQTRTHRWTSSRL